MDILGIKPATAITNQRKWVQYQVNREKDHIFEIENLLDIYIFIVLYSVHIAYPFEF